MGYLKPLRHPVRIVASLWGISFRAKPRRILGGIKQRGWLEKMAA